MDRAVARRWVLGGLAATGLGACAGAAPAAQQAVASAQVGPPAPDTNAACRGSDRLVVRVTGQGPDLVLVPGLASSAAVFDATVARLSSRFRCHQVQVAGFAGTPVGAPSQQGAHLADLATALSGYIGCLPGPVRLVGHSMGGVLSMLVARDRPQLVERLMVIDALPFFSLLIDPQATAQSIAPMAAGAAAFMLAQPDAAFRAGQERTMMTLVKSPEHRAQALEWSLASDRPMTAAVMAEVMTTDLRADLARIRARSTVLYAYDPMMPAPPDRVEALYRTAYSSLAGVQLERIDGALHFLMLDQPALFAAALDRFLAT